MSKLQSLNPSKNYKVIGEVEVSTKADVDFAIEKAKKSQIQWASLSINERCEHLQDFVDVCEKNLSKIAKLITLETSRSNASALGNVQGGIDFFTKYIVSFNGSIAIITCVSYTTVLLTLDNL